MRPSRTAYFMELAAVVAKRATCDRLHVGAVIVDDCGRLVATGYNGAPAGLPHCDDAGHELVEIDGRMSCVRTLHAESNAIDFAGSKSWGCDIYVTASPCYDCAKRIVNVGIRRVFYDQKYTGRNSKLVETMFEDAGIEFTQYRTEDKK